MSAQTQLLPGPLMIDLLGQVATPEELTRIAHPIVGGIILFARNYSDPEQLPGLINTLRQARPGPLLVAVDQEGGRVQRFITGFTKLPAAGVIGQLYRESPERAEAAAEAMGLVLATECRRVDLDISFAPVLDLDLGLSEIIGSRAFHGDPTVVVRLASAFMRGLAVAGMPAVGKHFPGHGGVKVDTHLDSAVDDRTLAELLPLDLLPYRQLAEQLQGIMVAHVCYPAVDQRPASASAIWLQQVARQQLGLSAVIFSDDLSMAGVSGLGSASDRVQAVLNAGCDMALLCNNPAAVDSVLAELPNLHSSTRLHDFVALATERRAVEQFRYRGALATLQQLPE